MTADNARYATYVSDSRLIPHIVCNPLHQIPTTLLADLENTGYYRQCYLRYTGNLIRLEDGTKLLSPTPRRHHSTPKSSSARSNLTIFAPEGIFCEKIEKKCGDRQTKRAEDFARWKKRTTHTANRTTG